MEKYSSTDLLEGSIPQQILRFFFPVMLGTFFQQLYNTIDAVVVGQVCGKVALAAVGGTTSTTINLLINFITGLTSGATVIIAQLYGQNDQKGVKKAVNSGMFLAVFSGAIMMILGFLFASAMLKMLNVNDEVFPLSLLYMRIYFCGFIPSMIFNVGSSILRAMGNSKTPLHCLIISCIVNIILDILFVKVLNLNVAGAALATIFSQVVSCILVIYLLFSKHSSYGFSINFRLIDFALLIKICIIGFPMGIQSVMYSISNLFIQSTVNSYGTDTMAAYTAFGKIDALYWNISGAFGTAALTTVGQNYGAGKMDRVKSAVNASVIMHIIASLILGWGLYFTGQYITLLFSDDPAVIEICMQFVRFLCPLWISFSFVEILSASLRACGDSLFPMLVTVIFICILRIIWLTYYPAKNIIESLYCYPISWIITSIILIIYYYTGIWKKRIKNNKKASI
ncbi:MAG: MATE family efflux transporter [Erysipelotrichia bacterium]|nr:MATE family efflux transporter [Erysipelotrichia bacterium]